MEKNIEYNCRFRGDPKARGGGIRRRSQKFKLVIIKPAKEILGVSKELEKIRCGLKKEEEREIDMGLKKETLIEYFKDFWNLKNREKI